MSKGKRWAVPFLVLVLSLAVGSGATSAIGLSNRPCSATSARLGALPAHADAVPPMEVGATQGAAPSDSGSGATSWPAWLEPRGVNVAELVGQVPEADLHGMILSYYIGIVVYESGVRNGNTATITTTIYPRVMRGQWGPYDRASVFGCPGQRPALDHMGSIFPASTMRLYANDGTELTSQVATVSLHLMDTQLPLAGSQAGERYPTTPPQPPAQQPVPLASNSGCDIVVYGDYYPLKGVFTFALDPNLHASVVAVQHAPFHSYVGPGDMGILQPLMNQMLGRFGFRHERIPLTIPPQANYFILRFPPMPGDYYSDVGRPTRDNASRKSSGTYRLTRPGDPVLSADLTTSTAWPLQIAWQDQDQTPGATYLSLLRNLDELAVPEYLIPDGIAYNGCFTQGNCPNYLLDQIHNSAMNLDVYYLSVTKSSTDGQWVSLKMAGPAWTPPRAGLAGEPPGTPALFAPGAAMQAGVAASPDGPWHEVYLPFITKQPQVPPSGCPCGWFDSTGRMLTYVASSQ